MEILSNYIKEIGEEKNITSTQKDELENLFKQQLIFSFYGNLNIVLISRGR